MKNLLLDLVLTITGIGAASGLVYKDEHLYLISDNSRYLYDFSISEHLLSKIQLDQNTDQLENIIKAKKPDFEAITFDRDQFYIYGSGSTSNRNLRLSYQKYVQQEDFTPIYQRLQQRFAVDQDNFNIEGVIHTDDEIWLFNRGNAEKAQNGIFKIDKLDPEQSSFHPISLPHLDHVQTAFTDAILVDDTVYFIAAAEDSKSNYLDGEVAGTILGKFKRNDFSSLETITLPGKHKFEGITLKEKTEKTISFFLCEDRDDDKTETNIYSLIMDH
ncbi:hypothetical protein LZQ00_15740 [Sphingobacterium sp. SRCM116780]|uniref:DUF6929 family protein n=1 Tax=Sphingobacterium sp. SRCM116780 TaxID=2907623 RepID=UPI001F4535E2|nr:hypothetical protein [Sphingobacterium sp. SRCM116780]UIR55709.1 hypothetical protein LZQ00_15740 [Sphingobacterium sp. SRCM116780]